MNIQARALAAAVLAVVLASSTLCAFGPGPGGGGNSGVSSIIAGTGISVDHATGAVTVTNTLAGGITCASVPLTSAQIKGLDITPVTLVAAPGVGKALFVTSNVTLEYIFGTVRYNTPAVGGTIKIGIAYTTVPQPGPPGSVTNVNATDDNGTPYISSASSLIAAIALYDVYSQATANAPLVFGVTPNTNSYNGGPITALTVANSCAGCAGYALNDAFTIDTGFSLEDTGDATGHVTGVSGGVPTSVAIDTPGVFYAVTTANNQTGPYPTLHTSGSGNNALTLNVTGATTGDGTAKLHFCYETITL